MTSANAGQLRVRGQLAREHWSSSRLGPVGRGVYRMESTSLVSRFCSVTSPLPSPLVRSCERHL
jgi:hypothetical protein